MKTIIAILAAVLTIVSVSPKAQTWIQVENDIYGEAAGDYP